MHGAVLAGIEWLKDTPSENIFRIEGSPRKFILLDRTDDKDRHSLSLQKSVMRTERLTQTEKTI